MNSFKKLSLLLFALLGVSVTATPSKVLEINERPVYDNNLTKQAATATEVKEIKSANIIRDVSRYVDVVQSESGSSSNPDDQALVDIHHFLEHKVEAKTNNLGSSAVWYEDINDISKTIDFDMLSFFENEFTFGQETYFNKSNYVFNKGAGSSDYLPALINLNVKTAFVTGKDIEIYVIPRVNHYFNANIQNSSVLFGKLSLLANSIADALFFPSGIETMSLPILWVDGNIKAFAKFDRNPLNNKVKEFNFYSAPDTEVTFSNVTNSMAIKMPQQNYIEDIRFLSLIGSNVTETVNGVTTKRFVGPSPYTLEFYSIDNEYTPESLLKSSMMTYETRAAQISAFDIKKKLFKVEMPIYIGDAIFHGAYETTSAYTVLTPEMLDLKSFVFANGETETGGQKLTRDDIQIDIKTDGSDLVSTEFLPTKTVFTYKMPNQLFENGAQYIVVKKLFFSWMDPYDIYYFSNEFIHKEYTLKGGSKVDSVYGRVLTTNNWVEWYQTVFLGKTMNQQVHNVYLYHDEERSMPIQNILDVEIHYQVGSEKVIKPINEEDANSYSLSDGDRVYFNSNHGDGKPLVFKHNLTDMATKNVKTKFEALDLLFRFNNIAGIISYFVDQEQKLSYYDEKAYIHHNGLKQATMDLNGSSTGDYARVNKKYGITEKSGKIDNAKYWNEIDAIRSSSKQDLPQLVFFNTFNIFEKKEDHYVNWLAPAHINYVSSETKSVVPASFWSDGRHIEYAEDGSIIGVFDQFGNLMEEYKVAQNKDGNDIIVNENGHYEEPDNVIVQQKNRFEDVKETFLEVLKYIGIALGVVLVLALILWIVSMVRRNKVVVKVDPSAK